MKNSNKIAKKSEKNQDGDQHCWVVISGSKGDVQKGYLAVSNKKRMAHILYLPSGTAFRVHVMVLPKKEMGSNLMKSEEKQDKDDFTYQGPSNRSPGGWSHDQLPKMVKKQKF